MSVNSNFESLIKMKFNDIKKKNRNENNNENDNNIIVHENNDNNILKNNQKTVTNYNQNYSNNLLNNFASGGLNFVASEDDDPIRKLGEIDEKFDTLELYDAPDSLGLETKDVPDFDEAKEREELEKMLKDVYDDKKSKTTLKYSSSIDGLLSKKDDNTSNYHVNESEINKIFDNESFKLESDAIKRGLSRSSIIIEQLSNVESQRAEKLYNNLVQLNDNLFEIESKIVELENELDGALSSLDIEKAEELEKQLQKKYSDYQKEYNSAVEFNNKVKQAEAEYKIKYENEKQKFKKAILDNAANGYDEYTQKKKYAKVNYMMAYLDLFDKDKAMEIFYRNSAFKDLLGDGYDKIVSYLNSRK